MIKMIKNKISALCLRAPLIALVAFTASCATVPRASGTMDARLREDGYILGAEDVIDILVANHPEWSGEFTIGPDGKIYIPGLEEIKAGGLTKVELAAYIEARLDDYIINPRVNIEIVGYASEALYVLGEVSSPGKYLTGGKGMTLRDAVIEAGLPTRYAATGRVFVISPTNGNHPSRRVINLYRILYRGQMANNILLSPGDVVYVPKNVLGVVNDLFSAIMDPFSSAGTIRGAVGR